MDAAFNLLVVDDEPVIAESIVRLLSSRLPLPVEVFCAYRGRRALEVLQANRIDLMVSDIRMPDMSGLELLSQVNRLYPECRTIFLTGYPEFAYAYEAFRQHAVGYILKTDDDHVLLTAVQEALAQLSAQLSAPASPVPTRSPEDLQHARRLFASALTAQKIRVFEDALPLMGFSAPLQQLVLLLSLVPGLDEMKDEALLESVARKYLPGLTRLLPINHPLPDGTLWLCQFEETPSQVYLSGLLEPVQVAFSAGGKNVSFLLRYLDTGCDDLSGLYRTLRTQAEKMRTDAFSSPFVYTVSESRADTPVSGLLQFIDNYVSDHICEDVSIAQLSLATGYNADYLSRLYRQACGQPLGRYLAARRLDHIRSLMERPELSLDAISQMSGFSSRSYFNRFIKRETRLTPQRLQAIIRHAAPSPEEY